VERADTGSPELGTAVKRTILFRWLHVLAIVCCTGCSLWHAYAEPPSIRKTLAPDPYEPDDTPAQATSIALNEYQAGHSIHYQDIMIGPDTFDVDYVTFTLNAQTTILLESADAFGYMNSIRDMPATLLDGNETVLESAPIIETTLNPGTYFGFFTGQEHFNENSTVPRYAIHLRDANLPDRFEPDDTAEAATFIPFNGDNQVHNFHADSDEDWVHFISPYNAQTTVGLTALISGEPVPNFAVFEQVGPDLVAQSPYRADAPTTFYLLQGHDYYVRLTNPLADRKPSTTCYSLGINDTYHVQGGDFPGTLAGVVHDPDDNPVVNAHLSVSELSNIKTVTDSFGAYIFPNLPSGTYTVQVDKGGFIATSMQAQVAVNTITPLDFGLMPGVSGDINGDNAVNAVDVQLVINAALGNSIQGDADVNGDNAVNAVDVQLVINAALGIR